MRCHLLAIFIGLVLLPLAGFQSVLAADLPPGMRSVTWELVTLQAAGQPAEDTTGTGLTIIFHADGTVSGSGGCNQFSGSYIVGDEGTMGFTPLASTRRACTGNGIMEREGRYFTILGEVGGYVLDSPTRLRLTFPQQGLQLVYQRGAAVATGSVTGTAIYLPRILPPADAVVIVQLQDTSRQGATAVVLAEQRIPTNGGGPPYAFTLTYDPAKIVASGTYAVRAQLEANGQLLFVSTRAYLVITQSHPTSGIEIVMDPTGAPLLPPTGGGGMASDGGWSGLPLVITLSGLLLTLGLLRRCQRRCGEASVAHARFPGASLGHR